MDLFMKKLVVGGGILAMLLAFCAVPLHRTDAREMPVFAKEPCRRHLSEPVQEGRDERQYLPGPGR